MNILAITSSYPRYEGDPTAPFIESITRAIAHRGHSVHLLLPESAEWSRQAVDGSIHFHHYRYSPLRSWTPWGYSASLESGARIKRPLYALAPLVVGSAVVSARRLLRRGDVDVVHAHWVVPNGHIAALAGGKPPLVVSLHGSDIAVSERSRPIGKATRWALARAAAVTAPSQDLLARAEALGARGLLELVPYGADVEAFDVPEGTVQAMRERVGARQDDVVVAGIGRLIPVKGFRYLIEAFAKASAGNPCLRLLVVGDGDERAALEERTASLDLRDSVTFAGMAAPGEIPAYLAASDVVVVPSVRYGGYVDGLPNVALEAMAAGKPLVASRVGGLPQLVREGETGLLVGERDVAGLVEALARLSGEPKLRERLGANARELVRGSMSWNATAERFESVFERTAGR